jgi:hypothetical protein
LDRELHFIDIMVKRGLTVLFFLALSAQMAAAERISCLQYLVNYAGRLEQPAPVRLEPWLSRLREAGLGELADLVGYKKIMVRASDKEGVDPIQWRTTLLRTPRSRGYMLILNPKAIGNDAQAFWKFANALYEIYFFRSLWALPQDFWDDTKIDAKYLASHAPAYFESLRRLTPRMYALYQALESSERAALPARQVSEPGALSQAARFWAGPVDNQLNQRDLQTFMDKGEARLQDVLKNRLEPRVIIGHYAGYARKALLITAVYAAAMSAYQVPQQARAAWEIGGAMFQAAKTMVLNPKDMDERYVNQMRLAYQRQLIRRDELRALSNPTPEERNELNEVEAEIQAILEDVPDLRK